MPSNHLILCRPLLLLSSIFPNTRYDGELREPLVWRQESQVSVCVFVGARRCVVFSVACPSSFFSSLYNSVNISEWSSCGVHISLGRGSALPRLGAELELRRSGSSLGPSQ